MLAGENRTDSANFSSIAADAKGVIQIFNVGAERMLGHLNYIRQDMSRFPAVLYVAALRSGRKAVL